MLKFLRKTFSKNIIPKYEEKRKIFRENINKKLFNIDKLDGLERNQYLNTLSYYLSQQLQDARGYKTLQYISPLSLSRLVDSKHIDILNDNQIIFLLLYLKKKKYLTSIQDTIIYDRIKNICITKTGKMDNIQINSLTNILQTFKIQDESLYKMVQLNIQYNVNDYDNRCLSNIVLNFTYISKISQGYDSFYEFLKEPICKNLTTKPYTSKDLQGYVKAYSKTYNMTENFMKVLEERLLEKNKQGNIEDADLFPIAYSFYLNKNIYEAKKIFDLIELALQKRLSSLFKNFSLGKKND